MGLIRRPRLVSIVFGRPVVDLRVYVRRLVTKYFVELSI